LGVAAATASLAALILPVPTLAASFPGRHERAWIANRSSKKVRPQFGQATSARSLNCFVAASLYAALSAALSFLPLPPPGDPIAAAG